jgi:hypothetical protein
MGRPGAFGPIVSLFEKLIVTQKIDVPVKNFVSAPNWQAQNANSSLAPSLTGCFVR